MEKVSSSSRIVRCLKDCNQVSKRLNTISSELRTGIIEAVNNLQPSTIYEIEDTKRDKAAEKLSLFDKVFTVNYDLLLYWIIIHSNVHPSKGKYWKKWVDGFAHQLSQNFVKGVQDVKVGRWLSKYISKGQNVFFLHGAVHLFEDSQRDNIFKVKYRKPDKEKQGVKVLDQVNRLIENKYYPTFIAEGEYAQKRAEIYKCDYLKACFEALESLTGNLVTFGWGITEPDLHIIDQLFKSDLSEIYVGIFKGDSDDGIFKQNMKCIADRIGTRVALAPEKDLLDVYFYKSDNLSFWK